MRQKLISILLCSFLILLIVFAPTASVGAASGLLLWFNQVLPVLMPFTLLVQLMLAGSTVIWLSRLMAPPIRKIFGLSPSCSFCILTGFLCGFPMGALTASQSLQKGFITRNEAQLLSAACNNAGPMFFTGYLLDKQLHAGNNSFALTVIFYGSALLWLWIRGHRLAAGHRIHTQSPESMTQTSEHLQKPSADISLRQIFLTSSELMLKIGIFMMLFSMFNAILASIPALPAAMAAITAMLLEITGGAAAITELSLPIEIKTVLVMSGAAFGGLCIAFQTYSLIHSQKLSFVKYLLDKTAIGLMTAFFTFCWMKIQT